MKLIQMYQHKYFESISFNWYGYLYGITETQYLRKRSGLKHIPPIYIPMKRPVSHSKQH